MCIFLVTKEQTGIICTKCQNPSMGHKQTCGCMVVWTGECLGDTLRNFQSKWVDIFETKKDS